MAHVVLIATSYDNSTRVTYQWANDLQQQLTGYGHTVAFLSGTQVTQQNLVSKVSSADYVLFYGHGEPDLLWAQPTGVIVLKQQVLVDTANMFQLNGSPIYAVACRALRVLGDAYANGSPPGIFLGYRGPFNFSHAQANSFRDIVNVSAVNFVNGNPAPIIVQQLQDAWDDLANQFLNGPGQNRRDAYLAGVLAAANNMFVGEAS
jgi:hypothetical protein